MADQFTIQKIIQARPEQIFQVWVDDRLHTAVTGGNYQLDPIAGGKFAAWDGYISGSFIKLDPPHRISMYWRASEFPEDAPDSVLEISYEDNEDGTLVTLDHSNIPEGLGENYRQGWFDFYLDPLVKYFTKNMK
jgi:uncharacterized protein YndB with AHSA1/START domain